MRAPTTTSLPSSGKRFGEEGGAGISRLASVAAALLILCAGRGVAAPAYDEQALDRAIRANPDDARAWFRLGVLQTHDGRILQAIEAFRQVIRIHPDYPEPHHNLAAIYRSLGDYEAAAEELRKVMALTPRDTRVQLELADLYMEQAEGLYRAVARRDAAERMVKRDRLAGLLCRRSLARLAGDGAAMERLLARLLAPPFTPAGGSRRADASPALALPAPEAPPKARAAHPPAPAPSSAPGRKDRIAAADTGAQPPSLTSGGRRPPAGGGGEGAAAPAGVSEGSGGVRAVVEAWRKAWESRDPERYFSFYSKRFHPRHGSRAAWERHKRRVLARAGRITVKVDHLRLSVEGGRATARFDQTYRSRRYRSVDRKELVLLREEGGWKIVREVTRK